MLASDNCQFELLGTSGCHLCDDAQALLAQTVNFDATNILLVDIADSDVLVARYGTCIPVLRCVSSGQELNWPFDAAALRRFLVSSG